MSTLRPQKQNFVSATARESTMPLHFYRHKEEQERHKISVCKQKVGALYSMVKLQ